MDIFSFVTGARLQVCALSFVVALYIDFLRAKHVKLVTTSFFNLVFIVSLLYLVMDVISLYTVYNMRGTFFNEIVHKLFYFFLLSTYYLISMYIHLYSVSQMGKNHSKKNRLWNIVYILCSIGVLFAPIRYVVVDENFCVYSYGLPVFILFSGIAFFLVDNFISSFVLAKYLGPKKIFSIRAQLAVVAFFMYVQYTHPECLTSAWCIGLCVLIFYMSFENPMKYYDEEANCYNKLAFNRVFFERIRFHKNRPFYLVSLVIDDYDILVSTFGKNIEKKMVPVLTQKLQEIFKGSVYRIADDTFSVMCFHSSRDSLDSLIRVLRSFVESEIPIDKSTIKFVSHCVVFSYPETVCNEEDIASLVNAASNQDRGEFVHNICEQTVENNRRREILKKMLKDAIKDDGFEVFFQPIFSTEKKAFISSEALVRLKDTETLGFVSPEEFVPLAEKNGFALQLGEIVFEKVCKALKELNEENSGVEYIEVNLSALQIVDDNLSRRFKEIMFRYDIDPKWINYEITETAAVSSGDLLKKNMEELRKTGGSFSMDDFGTGYSNLAQMAKINYDLVKIDKSLIWPAFGKGKDEKAQIMLKTLVQMISTLGAHIVAEGVETKEMVRGLSNMGVHYLQGYYYSKPIPFDQYKKFLAEKRDEKLKKQ